MRYFRSRKERIIFWIGAIPLVIIFLSLGFYAIRYAIYALIVFGVTGLIIY